MEIGSGFNERPFRTRDGSFIVIVVEGPREKSFFDSFRSSRVKPIPVSPDNNASSPRDLLDKAISEEKKIKRSLGDEIWIACDVDCHKIDQLKQVIRSPFPTSISNPCFEVFKCFYFEEATGLTDALSGIKKSKRAALAKSYFGVLHQKDPFEFTSLKFTMKTATAIERCAKFTSMQVLSNCPSTNLPRLVGAILSRMLSSERANYGL